MNEQLNEYYDNLYEEVIESSILENVEQYDEASMHKVVSKFEDYESTQQSRK